MLSSWHAIYASLLDETHRRDHHAGFRALRQKVLVLMPFADTAALLTHQRAAAASPEAKDTVLRILIAEGRCPTPAGKAAQRMLLLALWPGLDAVRGRLRRPYAGRADDLTADILGRACEISGHMDLGQVNRVAATFLRNLERDLRRGLQAAWSRTSLTDSIDDDGDTAPLPVICQADPATDIDRQRLPQRLRAIAGADADLVLAVVQGGFSQRDAGEAFGIGHDAARKRYQRAVDRLRAADLQI